MNAPDAPVRAGGRLAHLRWPFFGPAMREVLAYYAGQALPA